MIPCPSCGTENPAGVKFCPECGARLEPMGNQSAGAVRKQVTILFADAVGSTELGERLDPEVVREVMARYFSMMRSAIEGHGGTVEKFIGDAVMAVFGVPVLHEDDALRAVKAAQEIAARLATTMAGVPSEGIPAIRFRMGINTGDVVAGGAGSTMTLVTGDAVNTAARLEQAAGAGEILLGETTWRLVRNAATAEPVAPIVAKGKSRPLIAYRLINVGLDAVGHSLGGDGPIIGREHELNGLQAVFQDVVKTRQPRLVTVIGSAGVGKSRLVSEFIDSIGVAAVVRRGRCPSYGQGATWHPVRDVVLAVAGIDDQDGTDVSIAKLERVFSDVGDGPSIAARLAAAIGLRAAVLPREDISWAVQRLIERIARDQAAVVIFDDIEWAEMAFLDVVDQAATSIRDARVLLICTSRPELLERRPTWTEPSPSRSTIELEPLDPAMAGTLVDSMSGGSALPLEVRSEILRVAEGNPLFVEEMLGMLVDDGRLSFTGGRWRAAAGLDTGIVPPSIRAMLAARIDGLGAPERTVAERAAVIGRVFDREAVNAITQGTLRSRLQSALDALADKRLIAIDEADDPTYRFRHGLIRDAAYERIAKADRANLHERLADWLEASVGDRSGEYEEVIGYHLEQAFELCRALGTLDDSSSLLADRAATWLGSAARRAERRYDVDAAVALFCRARALLPTTDSRQVTLGLHLAYTTGRAGRTDAAITYLSDAMDCARHLDSDVHEATARLVELDFDETVDPARWLGSAANEIDRLEPTLDAAEAHDALALLWQQRLFIAVREGRLADAEIAARTSLELAERAGDQWMLALRMTGNLGILAIDGPMTVEDGLRLCGSLVPAVTLDRVRSSLMQATIARLEAMDGNGDRALDRLENAAGVLADVARPRSWAEFQDHAGQLHLVLGDPERAERSFRIAYDTAMELDDNGFLPAMAAQLGRSLVALDRLDEALALAEISALSSAGTDVVAEILWRAVQARVLAQRGGVEAVAIASESVAIARQTEYLHLTADALVDLAVVEELVGRSDLAAQAASEALSLFEAKGDLVSARRTARLLGSDRRDTLHA